MPNTLALVKGKIDPSSPVHVRMHSLSLLQDMLGIHSESHPAAIGDETDRQNMAAALSYRVREPIKTSVSRPTPHATREEPLSPMDLRDYGIGAQILLDLGVRHGAA